MFKLTKPTLCPCGRRIDEAFNATNRDTPRVADIMVCSTCAQLYMFNEQLELQPITAEALQQLMLGFGDWAGLAAYRDRVIFQYRFQKLIDNASLVLIETENGFVNSDDA